MTKGNYKEVPVKLPLIALRGLWIFPHMVIHFDVGREKSVKALEQAMLNDSKVLLCSQKDMKIENPTEDEIYSMGTIAVIKQTLKLPNGSSRVLVEGIQRAKLLQMTEEDGYIQADAIQYEPAQEQPGQLSEELRAAMRLVLDDIREYTNYSPQLPQEVLLSLVDIEDPGRLADVAASYIQLKLSDHYIILSELDYYLRLEKLHGILREEIELLKIEERINNKVKKQLDKVQRDYYLKEQLNVIKNELGEGDYSDDFIEEYADRIEKAKFPKHVRDAAEKELQRMSQVPSSSPEVNVSRTYLDYLLDLPWKRTTRDVLDIKKSRARLDADHYGLEDVKERVLEFLAVLKMRKTMTGPILCLVGPPGVGKTSIAKSIAASIGRKFVSMRLGGVRDEAEIRGHRKTYIAAMPGRIISLMIKAETVNPVFLLDEIDKLSSDFRGDPASALLEVLDPAQNDEFTDHFLELPYDLSKVMFITTANSTSTIPPALLDRMEVIRISGYTSPEKFQIAKNYLVEKQIKDHGVSGEHVQLTDEVLFSLIHNYTRESGVRELDRMIARVVRKAVKKIVEEGVSPVVIDLNNLKEYAGRIKYTDDLLDRDSTIGVVTGLAWTEVGGEILQIEANTMPGAGKIQLTGQLGDVMKESAMAALSYIRSNSEELKVQNREFYKDTDIHIHIPEGAIPKDGPSAGITMATAMISVLSGREVKPGYAMTGEMTLRGRVLPIGGVKEKVLAANRYDIKNIILPKENERDMEDIPEEIRNTMEFYYVSHIQEVLELVLEK
ncbi:MAG: endopeptidase La [Tissierellia bacterium]|nr:endopeptidase La [Tissierellia bacterium]